MIAQFHVSTKGRLGMRSTYTRAAFAALAAALALSACGGGGGASKSLPPGGSGGASKSSAPITLRIALSDKQSSNARHRNYVSRNTQGIGVSYEATGTATGNFGTTEATLAAPMFATTATSGYNGSDASCSTADPVTGKYTCTVIITAPAGYDDFQITTWDQAPISNGVNPTPGKQQFCNTLVGPPPCATLANDLSTATIDDQYVVVNTNNTFSYTFNPVVASAALALNPQDLQDGSLVSGTPAVVDMAVVAKDADGNIIVGSQPFVDANGTAITLNVTVPPPVEPGTIIGSPPPVNGNVTLASPSGGTCSTPIACAFTAQGGAIIDYNGYDTASATFALSVTGTALTIPTFGTSITFTRSVDGPINVPGPLAINEFPSTAGYGEFSFGSLGPDGNAWFVDYANPLANGTGALAKVATNGTITEYNTPGDQPEDVTAGPDGNVWATEYLSNDIISMSTSGTLLSQTSLSSAGFTGSSPYGIITGQDDNLWFCESGAHIGVMSPSGTKVAEYATGDSCDMLTYNPASGLYWFAGPAGIGSITPNGATVHTYNVGGGGFAAGASPLAVVSGPDGNVWFADLGNGDIGKIVTTGASLGTVTEYATGSTSSVGITVGADGALWMTGRAPDQIVRATTSGNLTEYTTGISSGASVSGIVSGTDGTIWFGEFGTYKIGKVTL